MLSLLLDENISPVVVRSIMEKRSDIAVMSIHHWHEGQFASARDERILAVATQEGLTLVTYDQKTILPLLVQLGQALSDHSGVVFVDTRTIASRNFGALAKSLIVLWDRCSTEDWTNRIEFLRLPAE